MGRVGLFNFCQLHSSWRPSSPYDKINLRLVFVGGAGYLLYDEIPDGATWAGAAIIIGAALYIARREAILGQNRR
ncbi:MAG: hypothetical protein AAF633_13110, partial [Chloroflexota bacterium]